MDVPETTKYDRNENGIQFTIATHISRIGGVEYFNGYDISPVMYDKKRTGKYRYYTVPPPPPPIIIGNDNVSIPPARCNSSSICKNKGRFRHKFTTNKWFCGKHICREMRMFEYSATHKHVYEECSICQEELRVDDINVITTVCGHRFHNDCIVKWTKNRTNCPMCRTGVYEYNHIARSIFIDNLLVNNLFILYRSYQDKTPNFVIPLKKEFLMYKEKLLESSPLLQDQLKFIKTLCDKQCSQMILRVLEALMDDTFIVRTVLDLDD